MKTLRLALSSALLALSFFATPAASAAEPTTAITATVSWEGGTNYGEWIVEYKRPDGTWQEVGKGPASPITFTQSGVPLGTYTFRVLSRDPLVPTNRGPASDEATTQIQPKKPGLPTIEVTVITTTTTTTTIKAPQLNGANTNLTK